jgi:CheY-like chemotaxis protein
LNREQLSDRQNEYSVSIHRSGEHLLKLLNDILELSRIESGYSILNPVNSDLFALFADIRMMFSQQAQSKRVQLTFETSDNLPQYILVDDNKLRQILINLIGNAMKFTDKGRISVRAGLDRTHVIKSMLTIEVQDSGAGISEHEIGNLFRQFEQASEGIKQNNGTGLGLALSRELAILMGGNITVTSKEGEGSVFTIRVEIKEGKPEAGEDHISKQVIGIDNPMDTYRILVVDDKEENLKVVVDFLHWAGFETQEAENGEKAIARFEQWNPHLILMDIRMPVMDGYEAIRRIRSSEKGKHTPMIVLTAGQPEVDGARFTELNIQSYIRKPFRESELFDTIGKILGIQYIYEEDFIFGASSRHLNSPENVAEDLAKLPEKLIAQMKDAIGKADLNLLIELIKQFESDNPELAKHLLIYANNFDYGYLNQIMKKEGGQ